MSAVVDERLTTDDQGESYGYVYRVARADTEMLRALVVAIVGTDGSTFGGASVWDFKRENGRDNLRSIKDFSAQQEFAEDYIKGDFGHAFSKHAEVRWKRRDQNSYDVLILTEEPAPRWLQRELDDTISILNAEQQLVASATEVVVRWHDAKGELVSGAWRTSDCGKTGIIQTDNRPPIKYKTYHAPNGAVQFVRYTEVKP